MTPTLHEFAVAGIMTAAYLIGEAIAHFANWYRGRNRSTEVK